MTVDVNYENRLVLFVDILGFKNIVNRSVTDRSLLEFVHECISSLSGSTIETKTYKNIPWVPVNKEDEGAHIITPNHPEFDQRTRDKWPISVTHFSDCIVMSAKADTNGSCNLLMRTATDLLYSFFERGILLRGGITVGKLIHESSGVLFGPALVEAYELESNEAKYPRFVVSKIHRDEFENIFHEQYLELFSEASDGYLATDVTQVARLKLLGQSGFSFEPIDSGIKKLQDGVKNESTGIKDKIEYIYREWELRKVEIYEDMGISPEDCT